jgi:hypothetical protein
MALFKSKSRQSIVIAKACVVDKYILKLIYPLLVTLGALHHA